MREAEREMRGGEEQGLVKEKRREMNCGHCTHIHTQTQLCMHTQLLAREHTYSANTHSHTHTNTYTHTHAKAAFECRSFSASPWMRAIGLGRFSKLHSCTAEIRPECQLKDLSVYP